MWTIAFNKANDVAKMSTKDLKEKAKKIEEELLKRKNDKYKDFLDSVETPIRDLFLKKFGDIEGIEYVYEEETEISFERLFVFQRSEERDSESTFIEIDISKISFEGDRTYLRSSECQKIIEFLLWMEDN